MINKIRNVMPSYYSAWLAFLLSVMFLGAVAGVIVFYRGLIVTNLSDAVPWGLWITVDISAIAVSAGAFLFCAAVYILNLEKYKPLARTATFVGLIGYSVAMLCLLLDIGRPDRFWHGFVFWNTHSVLWEVTMCVGLYFTVLILEVLPIFGRSSIISSRWPKIASRIVNLHKFAPYLAITGLLLSLLHQSSLGATYAVIISRPIWYRPGLAISFILSAAAGGISLTLLCSLVVTRINPKIHLQKDIIDSASKFLAWLLLIYLYIRFWDAFAMTYTYQPGRNEGIEVLVSGILSFNFWAGEISLGIIVPLVVLFLARLRRQSLLHLTALLMIVGGVVAYRWDMNLVGQLIVQSPASLWKEVYYAEYVPSLIEIITTAGIISFGLLMFTLGVKYLNVVDHRPESYQPG